MSKIKLNIAYVVTLVIALGFFACNSSSNNIDKKQNSKPGTSENLDADTISTSSDSLIIKHQTIIEDYYKKYCQENDNYGHPELGLEGEVSYEDDRLMVITFKEILYYGSWHTSYSSFVFKKLENQQLKRIFPDQPDTITGPEWDKGLAYPGRINGTPFFVGDLTGDQQKDFIFQSYTMVRQWLNTEYSFYTQKDSVLHKSILFFSEELDQGGTGTGIENKVVVDRNESPPLIEVTTNEIKYDKTTDLKINIPKKRTVYQWNGNEFVNAKSTIKSLELEIKVVQDSLTTLSAMGVVNKESRDALNQTLKDIPNGKDRAYFLEKVAINNEFGTIYDSLLKVHEQVKYQLQNYDSISDSKIPVDRVTLE